MEPSKERVFVRKASGLVRQVSTFDAFILNISTMTFFWAATYYGWAQQLAPGSNVIWGLLMGSVLVAFNAVTVGLFANIYPRTGGDYVYNSRVLTPLIGFTINFAIWLWDVYWTGLSAYWTCIFGLSALFGNLGATMPSVALTNIGTALFSPPLSVIASGIIIAVVSVFALLSTKSFFRAMAVTFVVGIIGIIVMIVIMLPYGQSTFITAFNNYMLQYAPSTPNYYNYVIQTARSSGWNYPAPDSNLFSYANWIGMVATVPVVGFGVWSCYLGGEIKGAQRVKTHVLSMLGSQIAMTIGMIVIGLLAFRAFGYEFLGASEFLSLNNPSQLAIPVAPTTQFFAMLLNRNPAIGFIIGLGITLLTAGYVFSAVIMSGRVLLAWSVDRVVPSAFSKVSEKHKSPYVAVLFTWIGATIFMILQAYVPQYFGSFGYAMAFLYGGTLTWTVVALSAILVPYLKKTKEQFNSSPVAKIRIAGIPVIVITGIISLFWMGFVSLSMGTVPSFGVNIPSHIAGIISLIGGAAVYLISRQYHKSKGTPIDLAFKEIPPE